jgi:hypothetical protein
MLREQRTNLNDDENDYHDADRSIRKDGRVLYDQ